MSPNPAGQQHQKGETSRNLTATWIQAASRAAPAPEGRETRYARPPRTLPCAWAVPSSDWREEERGGGR